MKDKIKLAAPWITYANQIEAMFKEDKDINFSFDDGKEKIITLRVVGAEKADAIAQLLPAEMTFGNISLKIKVIPANKLGNKTIDLFRKAFEGNPAVSEITSAESLWGTLNFIMFKPKVVQYYNDSMFDINGIKTTIYQDLAEKIFGNITGIYYCTEKIEE